MPYTITLTMDHEKAEEVRGLLEGVKNGMNQAISGAINKTLPHLRKGLVDDIKAHLYMKPADIRAAMKLRRASPRNPEGYVDVSSPTTKAIDFPNAESKGSGVNVQFGPGNHQSFTHAFIAKMPSGHIGIFERRDGSNHHQVRFHNGHAYRTELPIREIYGPTIKSVLTRSPEVLKARMAETDQWLDKQMSSQVDRLLNRKKPETGEGEE